MKKIVLFLFVSLLPFCVSEPASSQTAQVGASALASGSQKLAVDYVLYRPAKWNVDQVTEYESEYANLGGLLCFYVRNVSPNPIDLRFWRYNNRDESYWLLNHFIAWHRLSRNHLAPGETAILEIAATSRDFSPDTPFTFSLVDDTWEPCMTFEGRLREDPVNVSFIRILPGMKDIEAHVRYSGKKPITLETVDVEGTSVESAEWRGAAMSGPGSAIARIRLAQPLSSGATLALKVEISGEEGKRVVFAHRRAFADFFPVGTWGVEAETQSFLHSDHVDTVVQGGKRTDPFFSDVAARYGFHAMVHTGEPVDVDMVRDLSGHPAVACWMLRDEPDWSIDPQIMLFCDQTVRKYDSTIPTLINLCRNAKFFEYAAIPDIAGHDHYCVTAPSSSKWPQSYGTYLEETAYYTEDLKYAAEPRPVWIWSQGNHDGWGERPLRPVPTPQELSVQLVLNLGRGAKGILWFTYNYKMSQKYPETRESMRGWNRVMTVLRNEFLASEPTRLAVEHPDKIDVTSLASWDSLILCVTNLDYKIDPKAYPFQLKRDVKITIDLPDWIDPVSATRISGDGVSELRLTVKGRKASTTLGELRDGAIVVLSNKKDARAAFDESFRACIAKESRTN